MSKVEELEHAIEQLPVSDFDRLADWITRRRAKISGDAPEAQVLRDHSAFLNSYVAEDEGLYDDAQSR